MRAIDTNVLVRLLTRDDPKQVAAAERFVRSGGWVSQLVLAETSWVLTTVYEVKAEQLAAAIEMLLEHDRLVIQDRDVVAKALAHFRKRPALGFSDPLIVEIARKAGHVPLGTFDRHLGKVEGAQKV